MDKNIPKLQYEKPKILIYNNNSNIQIVIWSKLSPKNLSTAGTRPPPSPVPYFENKDFLCFHPASITDTLACKPDALATYAMRMFDAYSTSSRYVFQVLMLFLPKSDQYSKISKRKCALKEVNYHEVEVKARQTRILRKILMKNSFIVAFQYFCPGKPFFDLFCLDYKLY